MSVSTIATATLGWTGVETSWNPGFQAQNTTDVSIVYTSAAGVVVTLVLGTHFTAILDAYDNYTAYPAAGAMPAPSGTVVLARNSTLQQAASFQDGVPMSAGVIGAALDLLTLRDQELRRDILSDASPAVISTWMAGWLVTLPTTPGATGTWWSNDGAPTYVTGS